MGNTALEFQYSVNFSADKKYNKKHEHKKTARKKLFIDELEHDFAD